MGRRTIDFELTLPIAPRLLILQKAIRYTTMYIFEGLLLFPVGKLLLGSRFSLEHFCLGKFLAMFITVNTFFGCGTLLLAGIAQTRSIRNSLWNELLMSLWDFGGYYFTWLAAASAYPLFAYSMLLNPITYTMEGLRNTVLGAETSLNFFLCLGVLACLSILSLHNSRICIAQKT